MSKNNTFLNKIQATQPDITIMALRLLIGWTFFQAGIGKVFKKGGWIISKSYFEQMGLPSSELLLNLVGATELICGLLLLLGYMVRIATIPIAVIIFIAILTVHREVGYAYPMIIFASCGVLVQHGAGRFSLDALAK